jgi:hypothetical protein
MTFPETYNELEKWRDGVRRTLSRPDLIRAFESRIERESDTDKLRILNVFLAREHIAQGNQAAADAIHHNDPLAEIHRWHDEWRQANPDADIIPVLASTIRRECHPTKRVALHYLLAEAHRDRGDYASATAATSSMRCRRAASTLRLRANMTNIAAQRESQPNGRAEPWRAAGAGK